MHCFVSQTRCRSGKMRDGRHAMRRRVRDLRQPRVWSGRLSQRWLSLCALVCPQHHARPLQRDTTQRRSVTDPRLQPLWNPENRGRVHGTASLCLCQPPYIAIIPSKIRGFSCGIEWASPHVFPTYFPTRLNQAVSRHIISRLSIMLLLRCWMRWFQWLFWSD